MVHLEKITCKNAEEIIDMDIYECALPTEPCHHVCVPYAYQSSWTFGTVRPADLVKMSN